MRKTYSYQEFQQRPYQSFRKTFIYNIYAIGFRSASQEYRTWDTFKGCLRLMASLFI